MQINQSAGIGVYEHVGKDPTIRIERKVHKLFSKNWSVLICSNVTNQPFLQTEGSTAPYHSKPPSL